MTYKKLISKLKKNNLTISTMESCTGGALASAITNVEGASDVFAFGAVTYSNYFKIKMGVDKNIIDKYSVYSMETAREMSKQISKFTNSSFGVGITGKINTIDKNNLFGSNNNVFISIYDKINNSYYDSEIICSNKKRVDNKKIILEETLRMLNKITD